MEKTRQPLRIDPTGIFFKNTLRGPILNKKKYTSKIGNFGEKITKNIIFQYYFDFFVIFGYCAQKIFFMIIFYVLYEPQKMFCVETKNDKNIRF